MTWVLSKEEAAFYLTKERTEGGEHSRPTIKTTADENVLKSDICGGVPLLPVAGFCFGSVVWRNWPALPLQEQFHISRVVKSSTCKCFTCKQINNAWSCVYAHTEGTMEALWPQVSLQCIQ